MFFDEGDFEPRVVGLPSDLMFKSAFSMHIVNEDGKPPVEGRRQPVENVKRTTSYGTGSNGWSERVLSPTLLWRMLEALVVILAALVG